MNFIKILQKVSNAYIALCMLPFYKKDKNLWIIGGHHGQLYTDNAKVFYEYILREHKDIDIVWMVNKHAPVFNEIKDRKIIKGSIAGYLAFYEAKISLFSNTFNSDIAPYAFVLPFVRHYYHKQFKVYLGHGTVSFKKMPTFIGIRERIKIQIFNSYNLAIAATELEMKVMEESYGIQKSAIVLSGSARHDVLDNIETCEKTILIAPTWRPWLHKKTSLRETEFFREYAQLLSDKKFNKHIEKNNITVKFYLHHMFHTFENEFKVYENDSIILLNDKVNIAKEIMSASLLITDYSSISSDFYYLEKPVLFFQFDKLEYMQKIGSEIDLNATDFGVVTSTVKLLVNKLCMVTSTHYKISSEQKKGERFFSYFHDKNNCKRIYNSIIKKTGH